MSSHKTEAKLRPNVIDAPIDARSSTQSLRKLPTAPHELYASQRTSITFGAGHQLAADLQKHAASYHVKSDHHEILIYELALIESELRQLQDSCEPPETLRESTLLSERGRHVRNDLPELTSRVTEFHQAYAIQELSNADVTVRGSYIGLGMQIRGHAADYLHSIGTSANPWLLQAINDQQKFAAAHVLLTDINSATRPSSASHWNGMRVSLHADGTVDFHSSQIPDLAKYWQERCD